MELVFCPKVCACLFLCAQHVLQGEGKGKVIILLVEISVLLGKKMPSLVRGLVFFWTEWKSRRNVSLREVLWVILCYKTGRIITWVSFFPSPSVKYLFLFVFLKFWIFFFLPFFSLENANRGYWSEGRDCRDSKLLQEATFWNQGFYQGFGVFSYFFFTEVVAFQ